MTKTMRLMPKSLTTLFFHKEINYYDKKHTKTGKFQLENKPFSDHPKFV